MDVSHSFNVNKDFTNLSCCPFFQFLWEGNECLLTHHHLSSRSISPNTPPGALQTSTTLRETARFPFVSLTHEGLLAVALLCTFSFPFLLLFSLVFLLFLLSPHFHSPESFKFLSKLLFQCYLLLLPLPVFSNFQPFPPLQQGHSWPSLGAAYLCFVLRLLSPRLFYSLQMAHTSSILQEFLPAFFTGKTAFVTLLPRNTIRRALLPL